MSDPNAPFLTFDRAAAKLFAYQWPQWRVWPDGTVQAVEDGPAHSWMSDDYMLVRARDESTALWIANGVPSGVPA